MEQYSRTHRAGDVPAHESGVHGAARRVSRGIMQALELGQLVPGQRLVETDLAAQYDVGRNAVREAVQWLSAHGVIDATRHRSAAIRQFAPAEALDVLDVAEAILALAARTAAFRYQAGPHRPLLKAALAELEAADGAPEALSRARRHFHRALISIGSNRQLERLYPAMGLHVLHAQYRRTGVGRPRLDDFRAMAAAIAGSDPHRAEAAVRAHFAWLRDALGEG